jgi:hypothetical protein
MTVERFATDVGLGSAAANRSRVNSFVHCGAPVAKAFKA